VRSVSLGLFSCAIAAACGEDTPAGPDHTQFFETKAHTAKHTDAQFMFEVPTLFRTTDVLSELDARALRFVGGKLHVGTSSSVQVFDKDLQKFAPLAGAQGIAVVDLAELGDRLVVAGEREVRVLGAPGAQSATFMARVTSVDVGDGAMWIGTLGGLWRWQLPGMPVKVVDQVEVRDVAVLDGIVNAASAAGVVRYSISTSTTVAPYRAPADLADDDVSALAVSFGTLIVGSRTGISSLSGGPPMITRAGPGGLPTGDVTAIATSADLVLLGHAVGATAIGAAKTDHYHSRRWIPAERVTAVAIGEQGARWIATSAGVARIAFSATTLADRAKRFEDLITLRHWRMDGFVDDDTNLDDANKPLEGFLHDDKDNDGLWTQMQIGPWCMAYARTKDEQYYQRARKALDTMFMLIDLPAITFEGMGKKRGYIARSLVREDEGEVYESKKTNPQWIPVEYQGKKYFWKSDTSSDEYAGHFYGYPLFYDLCAKDEAEKKEISDRMRQVADYLIDGGYLLLDLDGLGTTHGHWKDEAAAIIAPNDCAERFPIELCLSSLGGGGWLNGMEILGHLLSTWHMTGDQKYYDAYEDLYTRQRYGDMIPLRDSTVTVTDPAIANHSDHELALLAYSTLLRYEPNADRRERLKKSIVDFQKYETRERNPWSVSVVSSGVALTDQAEVDAAIQTLREWPEDWRSWSVDNAHRKDAGDWPLDRHGRAQFDVVFPYDEIKTMKWNTNPYSVTGGGSGKSALAPTPWLIAYHTLRYHRVIE